MKWKNKGHEYDHEYESYSQWIEKFDNIYIFGAGKIGSFYGKILSEFGVLAGYIDNIRAGEKHSDGSLIYSMEDVNLHLNGLIVVCIGDTENRKDVCEQLLLLNYNEGRDFFLYDSFFKDYFPVAALYKLNKIYADIIELSVTERCTLKCKKCAHACNVVHDYSKDLEEEEIYESIDVYFSKIDFVDTFIIIGGEPLLCNFLPQVIEHIAQYSNQIGKIQITTNGTVIPSSEVLFKCRENNVHFRISNYSYTLPFLKSKIQKLTNILEDSLIDYLLVEEEHEWTDYGFDECFRGGRNLEKVFDECGTECREIRKDRLYYCIMARSVSDNKDINIGTKDYLSLKSREATKKVIYEYLNGYSDNGFLEMCNYCYGNERNNHPILAGEQD